MCYPPPPPPQLCCEHLPYKIEIHQTVSPNALVQHRYHFLLSPKDNNNTIQRYKTIILTFAFVFACLCRATVDECGLSLLVNRRIRWLLDLVPLVHGNNCELCENAIVMKNNLCTLQVVIYRTVYAFWLKKTYCHRII